MPQRLSATILIGMVTMVVSALAIAEGIGLWAVGAGFIPARMGGMVDLPGAIPAWITPFSSALIHGGWLHLGVNMLMLLFLGTQVERVIGGWALLFVYIVGALAAAAAQYLVDPSGTVPMVGASGAISALFGLFALFFGRPKAVLVDPRLNRAIHVLWLLATWVILQWMAAMLAGSQGVMLATPAHIGGFVAGLLMQRPILLWRYRSA